MTLTPREAPVTIGEPAPDFHLPTVHRDGTVSLDSYRGQRPVLLAIFRGLWCPFCRRAIAELGASGEKLRALGVETLGVVATSVDNARLYFRYRPTRAPLAADPDCATHRAYGLPKAEMNEQMVAALQATKVNPTGELPQPMGIMDAMQALDRLEQFKASEADQADGMRQAGQLKGQFLVDRDGIVRWANVECATDGLAGLGKFPTTETLLAAARAIV